MGLKAIGRGFQKNHRLIYKIFSGLKVAAHPWGGAEFATKSNLPLYITRMRVYHHDCRIVHIIKPKADKKIHALGVMIYKRKRLVICQTEADVFGLDKKMTEITSVIFWRAIGGSNL